MVPPEAVAVAEPLFPPLQDTFVLVEFVEIFEGLFAIMMLDVIVQLFESVAVTLNVPAKRPVAVCVDCPLLHKKENPPAPPEAFAVAVTEQGPLLSEIVSIIIDGWLNVTDEEATQLLTSVTVME